MTINVTPVNDAPTAQGQTLNPDEGETPTITLSGADRDGDELTYGITRLPADGKLYEGEGTDGREVVLGPNGEPFVLDADRVTYVPDDPDFDGDDGFEFVADDGDADSDPATVTLDYAPVNDAAVVTFTDAGDAQTVDEGERRTYDYTANDVDGPANPDVTESCGDAPAVYEDTAAPGSFECLFPDGPETHAVSVEADDGEARSNTGLDSVEVTVDNVEPAVAAPGDQSSDEGENKSFGLGSFADPGDDGDWTATVNWGDGSTETVTGSPFGSPGSLGSMDHAYADSGTYAVTVTVTEGGTGTPPSGSASFTVTVANVAPTVTFSAANPTSVDEGTGPTSERTYEYKISDPGNDTITSVRTSCGDGVKVTDSDANADTSGSFKCRFPDGPLDINVGAAATDSDGDEGREATQAVTVANVMPTVTLDGPATVQESTTAKRPYTFTVTDPGEPDGFEVE